MKNGDALKWTLALMTLTLMVGCQDLSTLSGDEEAQLATFEHEPGPPDAPYNQFADDPLAATFGQRLFFDRGMSSDGTVACANCHDPEHGFSDPDQFSLGVRGQRGGMHAPTVRGASMQREFLWDGRADSMWSQALLAIENPVEMDFSRAEVAHYIAAQHRDEYEAVFGPLPDLSEIPARAQPGDAAWDALSDAQRDDVQRVFANTGKALEAYQRLLTCDDTLFDRVQRGEASYNALQEAGAAEFLRAGCADCHGGPQFNRAPNGDIFHNLGLEPPGGEVGRLDGVDFLRANPFNGAGAYSDAADIGADALADLRDPGEDDRAAFKTPSLRGVTQRPRFFHDGSRDSIDDVLDFLF